MIEEVFDNLVDQFSDPFTFYRELIQNSMDAGSNQIDVSCEYDSEKQRVTITLVDSGEGMTEKVIDEQLTKLFSSTKENDLTKIGKFGIGFVSIFAILPELVVLDTGKDGQYWRVAFQGGTGYSLYRLEYPVEGTTIRLFKRLPEVGWPEFLRRSRETIRYWCGYSETTVCFNGETLNSELSVHSPCSVMVTGPGTKAVVGMTADASPDYGMYNHGLTLKQGQEAILPGLTFRIKSNYLEHTLTRDNVIIDKNYHKAIAILENAADDELVETFCRRCAELQASLPQQLEAYEELMTAAANFLAHRPKALKKLLNRPLLATLHHGQLSLADLKSRGFREGALYYDFSAGPVSQALAKEDVPVLWGRQVSLVVAQGFSRSCYRANEVVACPQVLERTQVPASWSRVEESLREYLRLGEHRLQGARLADFDYEGSCVQGIPCLAEVKPGQANRLFQRGLWRNLTFYPGRLLLNHKHPLVQSALRTHHDHPEVCAYALAKAALLQDGLPQDLEFKMLKRCWSPK